MPTSNVEMPTLPDLATCKKVGFIVPSSNTAVEPITSAIFQSLQSNVICLFTRLQVQTIGTDARSTSQFTIENMVAAARLLADAEVDAILWNGTSGMWLGTGLEEERQLVKAMQDATGVPCSTTTLATIDALTTHKIKRISIAVPYTQELTQKLVQFFTGCGLEVVGTGRQHPTPASNLESAKSRLEDIEQVIHECAGQDVQAVIVACTNWPSSGLVEKIEKNLDGRHVIIIDSILTTVSAGLRMAGAGDMPKGWGKLMET